MPAEVEIREEWTETQKIGIAIALLSDRNEEFLLDWVKDVGLGFPAFLRAKSLLSCRRYAWQQQPKMRSFLQPTGHLRPRLHFLTIWKMMHRQFELA